MIEMLLQIMQFGKKSNHPSVSSEIREKWLHEIRRARRVYAFQKWLDQRKMRKIPLSEITEWIYSDIGHFFRMNINLLLQLKKYGTKIKRGYGVSYLKQWYRMAYIVFVLRAHPACFRQVHLFIQERWDRVDEFSFGRHIKVQNKILGYPHREELKALENKVMFFEHCKTAGLRTPEVLSVFEKGKMTLPSNGVCKFPPRDLFVKEVESGMGRGAKKFIYKNGCYHDLDGKIFSERDIHDFLAEYSKSTNSILVQNALKNHDSWKRFSNGSLTTCRIVTGRSPFNKDEIIPFFASLKMPVGNSDADNYSKGGIAASVNIDTGRLTAAITGKPKQNIFSYEIHPDSGYPIKGEVLPYWDELVEFVKTVHRHFETLSVGWDAALTEDGMAIIEGNVEWGSDAIEGPTNVLIADTIFPEWFDAWAKQMEGKEIIPLSSA